MDEKQIRAGKKAWQARPVYTGASPQEPLPLGRGIPYMESCRVNGHEPPCPTLLAHLLRCRGWQADGSGRDA